MIRSPQNSIGNYGGPYIRVPETARKHRNMLTLSFLLKARHCILASFLPVSSSGKMLQVRMLSGEAVASIPAEELEELGDISGLKKRLSQLQGLAPRFRQRLLLRGEILEETATLHSPMDLHLVCLPFADVSQSQVNDLAAAVERGSYATVESMLQLPQDPDLPDVNGLHGVEEGIPCRSSPNRPLAVGSRCQQACSRQRRP